MLGKRCLRYLKSISDVFLSQELLLSENSHFFSLIATCHYSILFQKILSLKLKAFKMLILSTRPVYIL